MDYNNEKVRRQDRLLTEKEALRLLESGEYGVLSMQEEEGTGAYGIPVNYVWDKQGNLYVHCAPEGHKLRCLDACPEVSFCVVGRTKVIPERFTTGYESIVARCKASTHLSPEERMQALQMLIAKYSADYREIGQKYAEKSFYRTEIIRLEVIEWSGKCKKV